MYTFESRVRYSETDSGGMLTMSSLINYFQDCSIFQSEDLGLGVQYLKEKHLVWVLSAWQIVAERYPMLGERVTIGTQPYDVRGFLGYRNFAMLDEKGDFLAKANSLWTLLDTDNGRPMAVTEEMIEAYRLGDKLEMEYAPRKITIPEGGVSLEHLVVKKHHLDTNHHVNNQQFIDMAMDYLPEGFAVKQIRAEYKKQAFLDDVLVPYVSYAGETVYVVMKDEAGKIYVAVEFQERNGDRP